MNHLLNSIKSNLTKANSMSISSIIFFYKDHENEEIRAFCASEKKKLDEELDRSIKEEREFRDAYYTKMWEESKSIKS